MEVVVEWGGGRCVDKSADLRHDQVTECVCMLTGNELDSKERKRNLIAFEGHIDYLQTTKEVIDWCREVKVGLDLNTVLDKNLGGG